MESNVEASGDWHQIITDGGMGDLICALVAVDYNIKNFKKVKFHVWVPDYLFWFARHVLAKGAVVRPFSEAKEHFNHSILGTSTEWCTNHTCMRTHAVDYAFHMLSDRHEYDMNKKNYLQIKPDYISIKEFELPKRYAVLCATGVEPIRTMPTETASQLVSWLRREEIAIVFLGKEKSECGFEDFAVKATPMDINYSLGINLVNKTTLLESAKIINESIVYIGMDGGLTHLAGCTDAEIICGYTASSPTHVAPIRKGTQTYKFQAIEPDEDIPNRYFQTYSSFAKGNFQRFNGWEKVKASMTADKFIKALEKVI